MIRPALRELMQWTKVRWRPVDWVLSTGVAVYVFLAFFGKWQGKTPYTRLFGDVANILTFARARAHPHLFANDGVMNEPANYEFYFHPLVFIVKWFGVASGDLGTVAILPTPFVVTFGIIGYYVLGRALTGRRVVAAGFAFFLWFIVWCKWLSTYIGFSSVAMPREWGYAAVPWVLAAFIAIAFKAGGPRPTPVALAVLCGFAGLLTYAHSISAAPFIAGTWACCFLALDPELPFKKRLALMAAYAGVILVVMAPFFAAYLTPTAHLPHDEVAAKVALSERLVDGYFDANLATFEIFTLLRRIGLLMSGLVGAALVWHLRPNSRRRLLVVSIWLVVLVGITLLIPAVDLAIADVRQKMPFQLDLIRSSRFLIMFAAIFSFWGLGALCDSIAKTAPRVAILVSLLVCSVIGYEHANKNPAVGVGWDYVWSGDWHRPVAENAVWRAMRKEVPEDAKLLCNDRDVGLMIRWFAGRSVVHSAKDISIMIYKKRHLMTRWRGRELKLRKAKSLPKLVKLGRAWGADHVLFHGKWNKKQVPGTTLLARTPNLTLVRLDP